MNLEAVEDVQILGHVQSVGAAAAVVLIGINLMTAVIHGEADQRVVILPDALGQSVQQTLVYQILDGLDAFAVAVGDIGGVDLAVFVHIIAVRVVR